MEIAQIVDTIAKSDELVFALNAYRQPAVVSGLREPISAQLRRAHPGKKLLRNQICVFADLPLAEIEEHMATSVGQPDWKRRFPRCGALLARYDQVTSDAVEFTYVKVNYGVFYD